MDETKGVLIAGVALAAAGAWWTWRLLRAGQRRQVRLEALLRELEERQRQVEREVSEAQTPEESAAAVSRFMDWLDEQKRDLR